jgi:hypothetical protein
MVTAAVAMNAANVSKRPVVLREKGKGKREKGRCKVRGSVSNKRNKEKETFSLVPFAFSLLLRSARCLLELIHASAELDELRTDTGIQFDACRS